MKKRRVRKLEQQAQFPGTPTVFSKLLSFYHDATKFFQDYISNTKPVVSVAPPCCRQEYCCAPPKLTHSQIAFQKFSELH